MIDANTFPGRGHVAILRTRPETVLDDYYRLMRLCDYEANLPRDHDTLLKINLSWQIWFPSSSTTPWQLDGVIRALLRDGYPRERLVAAQNNSAVVDPGSGSVNNRYRLIQAQYGIRELHTNDSSIEWVEYRSTRSLAILDKVYPDGIFVPKGFMGKNMLHLPTMKTDAAVLAAGAMKNALGGLLDEKRHRAQTNLHDALVDLLQIQQHIHSGIFCVMDGTFAGEGPGPRALRPFVKNTILAGSDPVALDAMSAKIMGIDPMRIRYIRHAHERGLGIGNPREIRVLGDTHIAEENWHFEHDRETLASWGQKQLSYGALKQFQDPLLRSPLVPFAYAASNGYHDKYWYPFIGVKRAEMMLNTAWGQKFLQYSQGLPFNPGADDKRPFALFAAASIAALAALGLGAYYATKSRNEG